MTERIKEILHSKSRVVGYRQTAILIEDGQIGEVLIAADADESFKSKVSEFCKKFGVPVTVAAPMAAMGKECGIEVGAGVVGVMKA